MSLYLSVLRTILDHKLFLIVLFIVNVFGTIYGYYWYGSQLEITEPKFWLFVPDSPTASLFFSIALFGWIIGKHFRLIEAFAFISLIKYGLWAVGMNIWSEIETGPIGPIGWMLVASHFAMAVQAVLYIPKYRFRWIHVLIAAIFTLHNEMIDYVYGQMPIYRSIEQHAQLIGYLTFWLSICCILAAIAVIKKTKESKAY
nr:DUF1405 domain-containing protein [Paenisporosarcina cavernae]